MLEFQVGSARAGDIAPLAHGKGQLPGDPCTRELRCCWEVTPRASTAQRPAERLPQALKGTVAVHDTAHTRQGPAESGKVHSYASLPTLEAFKTLWHERSLGFCLRERPVSKPAQAGKATTSPRRKSRAAPRLPELHASLWSSPGRSPRRALLGIKG